MSLAGHKKVTAPDLAPNGKPSTSPVKQLSINFTGTRVAHSREDLLLRVWKWNASGGWGEKKIIDQAHKKPVVDMSWDPTRESNFVTVAGLPTINFWDSNGKLQREIVVKGEWTQVAYSADAEMLVVAGNETVAVMDVANNYTKIGEFPIPAAANSVVWPHKGHHQFLVALQDGEIQMFQHSEATQKFQFEAVVVRQNAPIKCVALDPRGRFFAVGSSDGLVTFWSTADFENLGTIHDVDEEPSSITVSRDGAQIGVSYAQTATSRVYDTEMKQLAFELPAANSNHRTTFLTFSLARHAIVFVENEAVSFLKKDDDRVERDKGGRVGTRDRDKPKDVERHRDADRHRDRDRAAERDSRDSRDSRDRDSRDSRDSRDIRDPRDSRDSRDPRDKRRDWRRQ